MSEIIMEQITLEKANLIIQNSIKKAREIKINPIMVVVLDHRGAIKACLGEDGISSLRFKIAHGKANGAFQMGMGSCWQARWRSRSMQRMQEIQPEGNAVLQLRPNVHV